MKKTLLSLVLVLSPSAGLYAQTDVFPVASVNPDRQSLTIEVKNLANFDLYCDRISTQVIYRSSQTINNLTETISTRGIWVPKRSTRRFTDGRDDTARLRILFEDAKIDVVKNDSLDISANVKCSYVPLKPIMGKLTDHGADVVSLSTSRDGGIVATAGKDQKVKFWNAVDGSLINDLSFSDSNLQTLFSEAEDAFYVIQKSTGTVGKYDGTSFDKIYEVSAQTYIDDNVEISKDGRFLALPGSSTLSLLQTANGTIVPLQNSLVRSDYYRQGKFQFNPKADKFAYLSYNQAIDTLYVVDLKKFPAIQQIERVPLLSSDNGLDPGFVMWSMEGNSLFLSVAGDNGRGYIQKRGYYEGTLSTVVEVQAASYYGLPLPDGRLAFTSYENPDLYRSLKIWNPTTGSIISDDTVKTWFSNPLMQVPGSQNFLAFDLSDSMIYNPKVGQVQSVFEMTGTAQSVRIIPEGIFLYSFSDQDVSITAMPAAAYVATNVTESRPTQPVTPPTGSAKAETPPVAAAPCPIGKKPGETWITVWNGVYTCEADGKQKFQGCDASRGFVWNPEQKSCIIQ